MMRRSSDPEVRRNATSPVSIESLDETAARDAVSVNQDGVQQIVASPANGQLAKSMQSLRSNNNGESTQNVDDMTKESLELTPLKASDSTVSLPNRVRYPRLSILGILYYSCVS